MRNDLYRLQRIVEIGHRLLETVEEMGITEEVLMSDFKAQWLVTTPLYNIGEQVNCVSSAVTDAYPDLPWASIAGLRHRLVHNYEGTNWSIIASIIFDELEGFVLQVENVMADLG